MPDQEEINEAAEAMVKSRLVDVREGFWVMPVPQEVNAPTEARVLQTFTLFCLS
jgi:hypothetical protein